MSNDPSAADDWFPQPIADRIRTARKRRNLEQPDLAKITGISRNTIGNYERGITEPSDPYITILADALKVNRSWLASGIPPRSDGPFGGGTDAKVIVLPSRGRRKPGTRRYVRSTTLSVVAA